MKKIIVVGLLTIIVTVAGVIGMAYVYTTKEASYGVFIPLTGLITFPAIRFWYETFNKCIKL